eukprot:TRINITY_DN3726_c0_g1_i1.p1 TRINITY_DN3726_c0_g1~~TRINITY_DN3726_c0_g1_i1.p1  ORF type:complete len:134 (+),score=20.70 TRINITY_DN3726_c0_g1_i1:709-1110(+)
MLQVTGSCHCRKVKWVATVPEACVVWVCNCSVCDMKANDHIIIPSKDFTLLTSPSAFTTYTFNTHQAKHTFCSTCGVQSFYTPRSNPDGRALNVRCLSREDTKLLHITTNQFNGKEWEAEIRKKAEIKSLSKL